MHNIGKNTQSVSQITGTIMEHKCPHCSKKFLTRQALGSHKNIHYGSNLSRKRLKLSTNEIVLNTTVLGGPSVLNNTVLGDTSVLNTTVLDDTARFIGNDGSDATESDTGSTSTESDTDSSISDSDSSDTDSENSDTGEPAPLTIDITPNTDTAAQPSRESK